MHLSWLFKPYPMMIVATFTVPLLLERHMEPVPGRLIAFAVFVVMAIATMKLGAHQGDD